MKIFITGGAGFIGSNFIKDNPDITFYNYDINKLEQKNVINTNNLDDIKKVDYVMDLADIVGVNYVDNIDFRKQLDFHIKVIDICKKYKKHLMYFSSSEVFGSSKNISESSDFKIINGKRGHYALLKLTCEQLVKDLDNYTIVRPFNVIGDDQLITKSVFPLFCFRASNDFNMEYTDSKRCFVFITDFIQVIRILIDKRSVGDFNIGNKNNYISIKTLAKIIKSKFRSNSNITKSKIIDPIKYRYSDFNKVIKETNYEFKNSINMIIEYFKK